MRSLFACAIVCAFIAGCGKGDLERVPVRGVVNVDGAPLAKGSIVFVPTEGSTGPRSAGVIENGAYAIAEENGPVVGKLRVEIRAEQQLGFALDNAEEVVANANPGEVIPPNPIPPAFNDQSTLVRETRSGTDNSLDFDLDTKSVAETEN